MSELFNNKYRIPSARLRNWNYANEAMYFVTICTKNRQHFFGDIPSESEKNSIILNPTEIGKIAHSEWYKTIDLRPDMNLELGEFVVMPNHIHGIVMIGQNKYNTNNGRDA
jgi:REP element-mobilizing transposase RayT